jgi:amino acid transporter
MLDPLSAFILLLLTIILCFGVKDSARFNLALVILTVLVIFLVLIAGAFYVDKRMLMNESTISNISFFLF